MCEKTAFLELAVSAVRKLVETGVRDVSNLGAHRGAHRWRLAQCRSNNSTVRAAALQAAKVRNVFNLGNQSVNTSTFLRA